MNEMTPGQAACIAWNAHYAEEHGIEARNEWAASDQRGRDAWDAAAQAAIAAQPQGEPVCADPRCVHFRSSHAFSDDVCAVPGCPCDRYRAAAQPQPAPGDAEPTASWQHAIRALADIRDSYDAGTMAHDTAHTALDRLAGLYPHDEQPAPELAAAMAESRQLRTALRTLADLWDASSDKDEETARRPNRARLVIEERATTRRACAADIRKLAGPEGK